MAVKSHRASESAEMSAPIEHISDYEMIFDRKKLLEITSTVIDDIVQRVSGDRFRMSKGDKERLAYLKILKEFISLQTALLATSKAPVFKGVPKVFIPPPPRQKTPEEIEEDREIAEAQERQSKDWDRMMAGLSPKY